MKVLYDEPDAGSTLSFAASDTGRTAVWGSKTINSWSRYCRCRIRIGRPFYTIRNIAENKKGPNLEIVRKVPSAITQQKSLA